MKPSNEVDRLFREKLDAFQISPSSSAWEQIQMQLEPKKKDKNKIIWYSIAASLALFILGYFITIQENPTSPIASISCPQPYATVPIVKWSTNENIIQNTTSPSFSQNSNKNRIDSNKELATMLTSEKLVDLPEVHKKLGLTWLEENEPPRRNYFIESNRQTITIRYVAIKSPSSPKNTLAKLLNYAQQVNPADLLADIKNAKEEFMISKFNLDE